VNGVRIPVLARNLLIVAAIAAVLALTERVSGQVVQFLSAAARIALLGAFLWWGYGLWRENRGTFSLSNRLRYGLYATVAALVIVIVTSIFWAKTFVTTLIFFALVAGLGYVIYRIWQESRRYYY
jgi:hypothetical protein